MNVTKKYQDLLIHKMFEEACNKFTEYASEAFRCFLADDYVNCFKFYLLAEESISIISDDFLNTMLESDLDFAFAYRSYINFSNYEFTVIISKKENLTNE